MHYEDRIRIPTPEGVEIDLQLAGLGSRMAAAMIDLAIQAGLLLAVALASGAIAAAGERPGIGYAIFSVASFVVLFGYHIVFETMRAGRTPGKRAVGLRVVRLGGYPVGLTASLVRNLVRVIDGPPFLYPIGVIAILVSPTNQRLGDIAAGTLVMRERIGSGTHAVAASAPTSDKESTAWDVSGITEQEVAIVRRFLARRDGISPESRRRIASELVSRLEPRIVGAPEDMEAEAFLERVASAKSR